MNQLFKTLGLISLALILLNSCDCPVDHKGFVLNELTNEPVENATIQFDNKKFTTDSNGYFEISYVTGFCPTEKYQIFQPNFKEFELVVERSSESTSYEVFERNQNLGHGYSNSNSNSFQVRNDTLFFFMEKKNGL
jgi:hypothetical protein